MSVKTVSILGCGWLGFPLAEKLLDDGYLVKGSTTSKEKLPIFWKRGLKPYELNFNPEPEGEDLADFFDTDVLIIDIPPKAGKQGDQFHPQQIQAVADGLRKTGAHEPYILYVSSTSIYPDLNREVVENDVVTPDQSVAPAFVEAEQTILALGNSTVLRFGGLLGYNRIPGRYVAGKQGLTTGLVPVNYIHRDDGVGVLYALVKNPQPGQTFNVVSPEHPTREAVYRKNCDDFGYETPTFAEPPEPEAFKIVSPAKLIAAIDYQFEYENPLAFYYEP
ncbi:SDR family NAD(P)-dependent oxidoreductase [Larkinella terrae]|uniref:SDR family NAD(P)-dependent oxidoreductase n=1 Tax=Larkinella terrae TaxID=2025311 RepID=A0A7K0EVK7_9BACT|nr:SDR family NAD(P)-dependent oxidoreductase [Larkinella terrae]MRS65865.1 SDR family NAD(P)-dependent oxidoreductase [Larkinella terrae]